MQKFEEVDKVTFECMGCDNETKVVFTLDDSDKLFCKDCHDKIMDGKLK